MGISLNFSGATRSIIGEDLCYHFPVCLFTTLHNFWLPNTSVDGNELEDGVTQRVFRSCTNTEIVHCTIEKQRVVGPVATGFISDGCFGIHIRAVLDDR